VRFLNKTKTIQYEETKNYPQRTLSHRRTLCVPRNRLPQPLWIVDGIMFDTFEAAGISKDDIKSVSVLKDSPLYGERGAKAS